MELPPDVDPQVFATVRDAFAEALGLDDDEVEYGSRVIDDLGAESLDLLDIVYRLERAFGIRIPRGGVEKVSREGLAEGEEYENNGLLTELALTKLAAAMPEVPREEFKPGLKVSEIPFLFRVATFYNLVIRLQEAGAAGSGAPAPRRLPPGTLATTPLARFVFLVHPFTSGVRRVAALRTARPGLAFGRNPRVTEDDARQVARLVVEAGPGLVEGVIVTVPLLPHELIDDQERALLLMRAALSRAGGAVDVVGLGSLLAVVAGRGVGLQRHIWQPVTTGAAATAWAAAENARAAARARGVWPHGPVAVLGYGGTVGEAVASLLLSDGAERLQVVARGPVARRAKRAGLQVFEEAEAAVAGCSVVVGAATTGGVLSARALDPRCVLVDVAIPRTLSGRPLQGQRVLSGEALLPPSSYRRGRWGSLYHVLAGYGPRHLFACLAEPMLMALEGRREPYAQGRRVTSQALRDIRRAGRRWGFSPVLARHGASVSPRRLQLR